MEKVSKMITTPAFVMLKFWCLFSLCKAAVAVTVLHLSGLEDNS